MDNNKIYKALFVNLSIRYVAGTRKAYLEKSPGSTGVS